MNRDELMQGAVAAMWETRMTTPNAFVYSDAEMLRAALRYIAVNAKDCPDLVDDWYDFFPDALIAGLTTLAGEG